MAALRNPKQTPSQLLAVKYSRNCMNQRVAESTNQRVLESKPMSWGTPRHGRSKIVYWQATPIRSVDRSKNNDNAHPTATYMTNSPTMLIRTTLCSTDMQQCPLIYAMMVPLPLCTTYTLNRYANIFYAMEFMFYSCDWLMSWSLVMPDPSLAASCGERMGSG